MIWSQTDYSANSTSDTHSLCGLYKLFETHFLQMRNGGNYLAHRYLKS